MRGLPPLRGLSVSSGLQVGAREVRLVVLSGRLTQVPVRVSSRARRSRIVVDGRRNIEVVVPERTPARAVDVLLHQHRAWLERQLARPPRPFMLGLQRDDAVWLAGEPGPLPPGRIDAWYRKTARARAATLVAEEGERLGVSHRSLAIRDQRTRWGSCSASGALSFNWRLVLAPAPIFRYVVVHELCHRLQADHSPAFWRLLAEARPGFEVDRRWLREHGEELLAYRVPES